MSQRHDILIVVNPISGKGRGCRTAEAVASRLIDGGLSAVIRHTTSSGDAEQVARQACLDSAQRPRCIVACGGDGTMQEVANALAPFHEELGEACPAMGLAPAGRCNDFARVLGIASDPDFIADVLAHGEPRAVDLGRVNGRYFCTVATIGVDADISSYVDAMRMPLRGTVAYIYGTLCVLRRYRGRKLRIEGDFGVIEQQVFVASSANTSSYGGAIKIAPDAVPDDGQLDLCLIDDISRLRSLAMFPRVLFGRHCGQREVRFLRSKRMSVESDRCAELWADGERIGQTPATIEVAPAAVRIMLPADSRVGSNGAKRTGGL